MARKGEREKILKTIIEWREKQPTNRCREMSDWCDIWFDEDDFLEKLREGKGGEQDANLKRTD
jgi:hypothetical protein